MTKKSLLLAGALALVVLGSVPANADVYFEASDGGGSTGVLTMAGASGTFSPISGPTGYTIVSATVSATQDPTFGEVDEVTITIKKIAAGTDPLTISFAATNFTLPLGPQYTLGASLTDIYSAGNATPKTSLGSTDNLVGYFNPANSNLPPAGQSTSLISTTGTTSGTPGPDAESINSPSTVVTGNPMYSLAGIMNVTLKNVGNLDTISASVVVTPIPEPGSVALFGTALLIIGGLLRRRYVLQGRK